MEELVFTRRNEAVTDSLTVAEMFHKRHDLVLRSIDNLIETFRKNEERSDHVFFLSHRKADDGQYHRMYFMNRDGFSLLVMGFTGNKAFKWKLKYIEAFNAMEKALTERKSEQYINARKNGILTRKSETDVLKKLVEHAKAQGSTHADMLYVTYTKLVNKLVGVKTRADADFRQLTDLMTLERVILSTVEEGISKGLDYHEIYKECKKKCELVSEIAHFGDYPILVSEVPA